MRILIIKDKGEDIKGFRFGNTGYAGSNRVIRGGSWNNSANNIRSANRNNNNPSNSNNNIGFRLAQYRLLPDFNGHRLLKQCIKCPMSFALHSLPGESKKLNKSKAGTFVGKVLLFKKKVMLRMFKSEYQNSGKDEWPFARIINKYGE